MRPRWVAPAGSREAATVIGPDENGSDFDSLAIMWRPRASYLALQRQKHDRARRCALSKTDRNRPKRAETGHVVPIPSPRWIEIIVPTGVAPFGVLICGIATAV